VVGGAAGVAGSMQVASFILVHQPADSCFKAASVGPPGPACCSAPLAVASIMVKGRVEGFGQHTPSWLVELVERPIRALLLQALYMVRLHPAWRVMSCILILCGLFQQPGLAASGYTCLCWSLSYRWPHPSLHGSAKVFTPATLCLTGMGHRWLAGWLAGWLCCRGQHAAPLPRAEPQLTAHKHCNQSRRPTNAVAATC